MEATPWHEGELRAQRLAGGGYAPGGGVRSFMPDQHRLFFARLPFAAAATVNSDGAPVATLLRGGEGFIASPDPASLAIAAAGADPSGRHLKAGAPIALLGIELATRRRNRANGRIAFAGEPGLLVAVDQSFGNCPQYIQARQPRWVTAGPAPVSAPELGPRLGSDARRLVTGADTCFVASAAPQARGHAGAHGVDMSHRGGRPGFVHLADIDGHSVLTLPDFRGNNLFNTLGNIAVNPRAGLLFVDPGRGDVLQLSGAAHIEWDGDRLAAFSGALRLLVLTVTHSRWWPAALPLRWSAPEPAPQLAATGRW